MSLIQRIKTFFSVKTNVVFFSFLVICCAIGIAYGCTYISSTFVNNIYMDQIRYYANYTDKILNGGLTVSDIFNVYAGHIGVGTMLLLIFDIKVLGVNPSFWACLIPFVLAATATVLSCFLYPRKSNWRSLGFSLFSTTMVFLLIFGVQQWEILTFSWGLIIHLGNLFFVISFLLFSKLLVTEDFSVKWTIASLVVSGLNILLFGGGYDFPFLLAILFVFAFYFIFHLARRNHFSKWKIIPASIIVAYLIVLLILARNSIGAAGSGLNLLGIIESFVQGQTIVLLDRGKQPSISMQMGLFLGILLLVFYVGAVVLYFVRKKYHTNLLPLLLMAFSQLAVLAIAFARTGDGGSTYAAASRYYSTYILGYIAASAIYIEEIERLLESLAEKSKAHFASYVSGFGSILLHVLMVTCFAISTDNEWKAAPYRKQTANQQVYSAFFWDKMPAESLSLLYQESAENVATSFTTLKKNNLYVFRNGLSGVTDSLATTVKVFGFYPEPDFLWVSGSFIFLISAADTKTMPLTFYNPDSFPDNSITVDIDGTNVTTLDISSGSRVTKDFSLDSGVHTITITAAKTTIPSQQQQSQDGRSLSVILQYFTLS